MPIKHVSGVKNATNSISRENYVNITWFEGNLDTRVTCRSIGSLLDPYMGFPMLLNVMGSLWLVTNVTVFKNDYATVSSRHRKIDLCTVPKLILQINSIYCLVLT